MTKRSQAATYEQLYTQLQAIVVRLEAGDIPLDESLRLYEQGIELANRCQTILDTAELRMQQLQAGVIELDD